MVSGGIAAVSIAATAAAGGCTRWRPGRCCSSPWCCSAGTGADRPLIDSAIITAPGARKLTADMVVRACIAAKLCTEAEPIAFVAPGVHRDGEGFRVVFDLPYGSKAATAINVSRTSRRVWTWTRCGCSSTGCAVTPVRRGAVRCGSLTVTRTR